MLYNTKQKYGLISILFHWSMAFLMIFMLIMGNFLDDFPKELNIMMWHKSFGILILSLLIFRLIWRIISLSPNMTYRTPFILKLSASIAHGLLYLAMFIMPFSGWVMSKLEYPINIFNLFTLPHLTNAGDKAVRILAHKIHVTLPNILIALIALHIIAALYHHFILRDDTLRKMMR